MDLRTAAASSTLKSSTPSTDWSNGSASDSSPEGYAFESRIDHWIVDTDSQLTVHPQEYDTDKGGGQLDYVISAKRRPPLLRVRVRCFDNILVSLMVIEVLEDVQVRALLGEP